MGASPGEMPSFDFDLGPEQYYNSKEIAHKVVWPLLREKWDGGDWLHESEEGDEFIYPKRYLSEDGIALKLQLDALCLPEQDEQGAKQTMRTVTVTLEELVNGHEREVLLQSGKDKLFEQGFSEDDAANVWSFDEETVQVKRGSIYIFDVVGNVCVRTFQSFEDDNMTHNMGEGDEFDDARQELGEYDVEILRVALDILQASPELRDVLETIQKNPYVRNS